LDKQEKWLDGVVSIIFSFSMVWFSFGAVLKPLAALAAGPKRQVTTGGDRDRWM
jgi:hypothetical protein